MRYGDPSIPYALRQLQAANVRRLLVLPLFPQYSATTVASTFDAVTTELQRWRWLPELRFITHYHDQAGYIAALVESIREAWQRNGQSEKLVFSFHGIPKRYFMNGDPYYCECQKTARLVAEALDLPKERYVVAFQSRFGREEWLKPYTSETLEELAKHGVQSVDVICPGFAADCLETLEEIDGENREVFLEAGGRTYHYIPALNDSPAHLQALSDLALKHLQGWLQPQPTSA
jgi:ferrochelatase